MQKRSIASVLLALGLGIAGTGASAQMPAPQFPPRCAPEPIRDSDGPQDPCGAQVAIFGPSGPMVVARRSGEVDVDATGSIGDLRPSGPERVTRSPRER